MGQKRKTIETDELRKMIKDGRKLSYLKSESRESLQLQLKTG